MGKIKGPRKTRKYPDEYKVKAICLADQPDILATEVADALGIHPNQLYRWRKEFREGKIKVDKRKKILSIDVKLLSDIRKLTELEHENQRLKIENELLKKTIEFNSEKRRKSSSS
jgi:transposase